jgi:nitrite reductase/ring-hydroxylating ferredoxin subunit
VCPWHGYEYDLKTGKCVGDPKLRLQSYDVVEKNGNIFVLV